MPIGDKKEEKLNEPVIKQNLTTDINKEFIKKPRKVVIKKQKPIVVKPNKPTLEKKLTKKQIENEKVDKMVPQQTPKNESFMVESIQNTKRSEDKYISVSEKANIDERKLISDKIQKNDIVFSHYCINNDIGYHYYRVLTK